MVSWEKDFGRKKKRKREDRCPYLAAGSTILSVILTDLGSLNLGITDHRRPRSHLQDSLPSPLDIGALPLRFQVV